MMPDQSQIPAGPPLAEEARYAAAWQCDLGNGEWDHDWRETHESSGELDGGPGDHWTTTECRVCGAVKPHNSMICGESTALSPENPKTSGPLPALRRVAPDQQII